MSELTLTIKKVCEHCGKEMYITQNKRRTDTFDSAMPVHNGSHVELHIGGKFLECEVCGYSNQMLHIDINSQDALTRET